MSRSSQMAEPQIVDTEVVEAELVPVMDRNTAERLDGRIRRMVNAVNEHLSKLQELVDEAKRGDIHVTLGYPSWTAYLADVFTVQVRFDREQRRELVGYLSGEGMSQRVIADVVGASVGTVNADRAGVQNRTPEENSSPVPNGTPDIADANPVEEFVDAVVAQAAAEGDMSEENIGRIVRDAFGEEVLDDPLHVEQKKIIGRDGKSYPAKPPQPQEQEDLSRAESLRLSRDRQLAQKPRRRPITDAFDAAVYDLGKDVKRLAALVDDDRFDRNRSTIAATRLSDLQRAGRLIDEITDKVEDEVVDQQVADAVARWAPSPTEILMITEGALGHCMEYVSGIDIGDVEKNLAIQYKATILDHLDAIHDLIEKWEIK
jgi:hypothetical protein